MGTLALTLAIGLASGVLSGMFGIGGGIVTTPALRLLLHASALQAVGTPLPVIIPSALAGAITYGRRGLTDVRAGLILGLSGSAFAVAGAIAAVKAGGRAVLVVTAALIVYMAADMVQQVTRKRSAEEIAPASSTKAPAPAAGWLALAGAMTGLYSGFLGLGGGFVLVPLLTRWFKFPVKRAIGTSLVTVGILAVPGSIAHYLLGNVDVAAAGLLALGVVPGALIGARITLGTSDKAVRIGFAALLACVGLLLALSELAAR